MNKKLMSLGIVLTVVLGLASCGPGGGTEGPVAFSPKKPQAGETLTVTYKPKEEPFLSADAITLLAYSYTKSLPTVIPVELTRAGARWTGTLQPEKDVRLLALKFRCGDEIDNNGGLGYFLMMSDGSGEPVPGARAGLAEAYASWGNAVLGMDPDSAKAIPLFEEEFRAHPDRLSDHLFTYLRALTGEKPEGYKDRAMKAVDEVAAREDLDDDALNMAINGYGLLEAQDKRAALTEKAKKLFPKGYQAQYERLAAFRSAKGPEEQIELMKSFAAEFPDSNMTGTMAYYVLNGLLAKNDTAAIRKIVAEYGDDIQDYSFSRIASALLEKRTDLDMALEMADLGIARAQKSLLDPESKPSYVTDDEWKDRINQYTLSGLMHVKGGILQEQGKKEEALAVLQQAVEMAGGENPEISESYASALLGTGSSQKALDLLSASVKEGRTTTGMKGLLESAYRDVKGTEDGFDAYYKGLDDIATEKLRAELVKDMEDKPAPDFALEDLDGNIIRLSEMKGKTLVLDFWATWCGPCVSAFPAMNRARALYEADGSVEFLFINTWQDEEDKKAVAQKFITTNNYPFHVLLDLDDAVVAAYKVRGIPTKFIVDKNGRIRFNKIGFDGNDDRTVKELQLMIEMVK